MALGADALRKVLVLYDSNAACVRTQPTSLAAYSCIDFTVEPRVPWLHKDAAMFRASLERILAWDFDRIVTCHGGIVESDGREILRRLCARWL